MWVSSAAKLGLHCAVIACTFASVSGLLGRNKVPLDADRPRPVPRDVYWKGSPPDTFAESCSDAVTPKVAVCVSGAARTMTNKEVYSSFARHILAGTRGRGLQRAEIDVFAHVKLGDSPNKRQGKRDVDFDPVIAERAAVGHALEAMHATRSELVDGEGPYPVGEVRSFVKEGCFDKGFFQNDNHLSRAMNQFWSIDKVHKMMEEEERAAGEHYDIVVFVRPDLLWNVSLPESILNCNRATFQRPAMDWASVVPRNVSEFYKNILSDFFISPTPEVCRPATSEKLVESSMKSMKRRGVYVEWGVLDVPVLRPDGSLQTTR